MTDKQIIKFGDICREVKKTSKDPIADGYERYIGLEHLDSGSLKIKRWGMIAEDNPSFTRVFKKGHILFGKRRPYLKKAAIAEFDGVCSGDIIVLEFKKGFLIKDIFPFIFYNSRLWEKAIATASGSLSPRTKYKDIKELNFLIPSIDKQRLIAKEIFNISIAELANEKAIASCDVLIEKLLPSLISNEESSSKMKFKEVFNIRSGKGFKKNEYVSSGVKLLRIDNVSWDRVDWENIAFLPFDYINTYPDLNLKENDIVVALNRPITQGKLKIAKIESDDLPAILYQRVGLISSKIKYLTPDVAFYILRYHVYNYVKKNSVGSDQPFINLTGLRESELFIPDEKLVKNVEVSLNVLFSIRKSLIKSLLSKGQIAQSIIDREL
ncbi:TPA: restriction endonuclease subunit S [Enterobacter cloacae]